MARPFSRAVVAGVLALAGLLSLTAAPASTANAQDGAVPDSARAGGRTGTNEREPSRVAPPALTFGFGLERLRDDNVLQLTPHGFDRFAQNPDPPRFLIVSPDDDINVIRGDVRWRTRPLPRRETRVSAAVDAYAYQRNEVKDWQQYKLSLRQELTASRRRLATLELSWNELPRYYLGQITDADASFEAGSRVRNSLSYAQRTLGARIEQAWARGRLVLGAGFDRIRRDYGSSFDERDNDNDQWQLDAEMSPFRRWGASARLIYLAGSLDARGDLESSPIRDTDISFDHHGLGGGITLPWGRGAARGRIEVELMPERRVYTTSDKFDLNRYGRINRRLETTVRVYQRVWGPFEAMVIYDRLTSDASFTQGIDFDADVTDFDQTRTGLMVRGRWGLLGR